MYALPFDNWTMLFHVNLNLMKEAGLVNADGTPVLPTSVDEFFEQGKKFKDATRQTVSGADLCQRNSSLHAHLLHADDAAEL